MEQTRDDRWFGKLTWTPRPADLLELSGGYVNRDGEHYGMTGFESEAATWRYTSPTLFGNVRWLHAFGSWATVEGRVNRFQREENYQAYHGADQPGIRTFALVPPHPAFLNAAYTLQSQPVSTAGSLVGTFQIPAGENEHLVKLGGEFTSGSFVDRRIRNGGMTWMPGLRADLDPADPLTWFHGGSAAMLPTQWGGEVDLDAAVLNAAAFLQTSWAVGPRLVVSPGLRWTRRLGFLDPASGPKFLAVESDSWDPRVGLAVELDGRGTFIAKGHWGRYHQDLVAQMFDRAAGGDVFTNEELWYYRGPPFTDPSTRFTVAQRDSLAAEGLFTLESTIVLNETGRLLDYAQPYMDQWLVGLEKQFAGSVKVEALFTRRTNHEMVALVDLNRATNYTRFDQVLVLDAADQPLEYDGEPVILEEVYIPNNVLLDRMRFCVDHADPGDVCDDLGLWPPGITFADTVGMTWDPDFALTNAPGAFRTFNQVQLNVEVARPDWGGSFSVAFSDLRGNLDNVTGYTDPAEYGAGPYVRVNEGVNATGILGNFAEREAKASVWGKLPWGFRGGLFGTYSSGDHYSPRFRLSALGRYSFRANVDSVPVDESAAPGGENLDWRLFETLEGHTVFVGPRGGPKLDWRATLDIRLDRELRLSDYTLRVSLDAFNILGMNAVTRLNPLVNYGSNSTTPISRTFPLSPPLAASQYFKAPLDRTPPRTLRLGASVHF